MQPNTNTMKFAPRPPVAAAPTGSPLGRLVGQRVEARLSTGGSVRGRLAEVAVYEVEIDCEDGKRIVLMKHGIVSIAPLGGRS